VLRHLIIKMPKPVTSPSPMMREEKSRSMMERGVPAEAGTEPPRVERPAV
jgi:small subunit ribosomal protein S6